MKSKILCLGLLILILCLYACAESSYLLRKSVDDIEKIEIVSAKTSQDYSVLKTLSDDEKESFLVQFQEVGFRKYIAGDPMSVSGNAIKITYSDGSYEMVCDYWSEYVEDGKIYFNRCNCDEEEFLKLLEDFS